MTRQSIGGGISIDGEGNPLPDGLGAGSVGGPFVSVAPGVAEGVAEGVSAAGAQPTATAAMIASTSSIVMVRMVARA